jgi:hypothetical protein
LVLHDESKCVCVNCNAHHCASDRKCVYYQENLSILSYAYAQSPPLSFKVARQRYAAQSNRPSINLEPTVLRRSYAAVLTASSPLQPGQNTAPHLVEEAVPDQRNAKLELSSDELESLIFAQTVTLILLQTFTRSNYVVTDRDLVINLLQRSIGDLDSLLSKRHIVFNQTDCSILGAIRGLNLDLGVCKTIEPFTGVGHSALASQITVQSEEQCAPTYAASFKDANHPSSSVTMQTTVSQDQFQLPNHPFSSTPAPVEGGVLTPSFPSLPITGGTSAQFSVVPMMGPWCPNPPYMVPPQAPSPLPSFIPPFMMPLASNMMASGSVPSAPVAAPLASLPAVSMAPSSIVTGATQNEASTVPLTSVASKPLRPQGAVIKKGTIKFSSSLQTASTSPRHDNPLQIRKAVKKNCNKSLIGTTSKWSVAEMEERGITYEQMTPTAKYFYKQKHPDLFSISP